MRIQTRRTEDLFPPSCRCELRNAAYRTVRIEKRSRALRFRTDSAQTKNVVGDRADLRIAHLRSDRLHHLVRVVPAVAGAKRLELRLDVFRVLAREARVLGRQPRAGSAVTPRARGDSLRQIPAAPELASERHGFRTPRRARLGRLGGEIRGDVANVLIGETRGHSAHHRILALGLLTARGFEIAELLLKVLGYLAREFGIGRSRAVAVGAVARGADLVGDALPFGGIGLGLRL